MQPSARLGGGNGTVLYVDIEEFRRRTISVWLTFLCGPYAHDVRTLWPKSLRIVRAFHWMKALRQEHEVDRIL